MSSLDEELNDPANTSDYEKTMEITQRIDTEQGRLDEMYSEWEELSLRLDEDQG